MAQPRIIRRPGVEAGTAWPDSIPPLLRRVYAARGATTPDLARPRLASLLDMVRDGAVRVDIGRHFPLEQVPEAFALSMAGTTSGKILVDLLG